MRHNVHRWESGHVRTEKSFNILLEQMFPNKAQALAVANFLHANVVVSHMKAFKASNGRKAKKCVKRNTVYSLIMSYIVFKDGSNVFKVLQYTSRSFNVLKKKRTCQAFLSQAMVYFISYYSYFCHFDKAGDLLNIQSRPGSKQCSFLVLLWHSCFQLVLHHDRTCIAWVNTAVTTAALKTQIWFDRSQNSTGTSCKSFTGELPLYTGLVLHVVARETTLANGAAIHKALLSLDALWSE